MSSIVPTVKWCGESHPHGPHRWGHSTGGAIALWAECPGAIDSDTLPVPYLACPNCGASIRARMSDD